MSNNEIHICLKQIRDQLSANADLDRAQQMKAYMKHHFDFYGIAAVDRRAMTKPIIRKTIKLPLESKFLLAHELWQLPQREYQYVAMDILAHSEKKINRTHIGHTLTLIQTKSWWDTVDWLASHLIGNIFRIDNKAAETYLLDWLESDNIWLNRTCLIYQLFYKNDTDYEQLKAFILILKDKDEFFIQKAIGWALRQYSKTDALAVEDFLLEHTSLSGLARREVMKYINKKSES